MIYIKPHTEDNRENYLCDGCRWKKLCNEQNKTYAPMLTACACNIALLEESAIDIEQVDGKIVATKNPLRYSQVFANANYLLERLFCANILCDTPHVNDELRTVVQKWLGEYYGKDFAERLRKHPNEKQTTTPPPPNFTPQESLDLYTDNDPLINCGLL